MNKKTIKNFLITLIFIPCLLWGSSFGVAQAADGLDITLPVNAPPESRSGSLIKLAIFNLEIRPEVNHAVLQWSTSVPATYILEWGESKDYLSGIVSSNAPSFSHQTQIAELKSSTRYFYRLSVRDSGGRQVVREGDFVTKSGLSLAPLANVSQFKAEVVDGKIRLTWKNPSDSRFYEVRLIRSDKGRPYNPHSGKVIYEGKKEFVEDADIRIGETYHYAIFAKNTDGSYSSGSVLSIRLPEPGKPVEENPLTPGPATSIFALEDFDFRQEGRKLPVSINSVKVIGGKYLVVSLDMDKAPAGLKAILLNIRTEEGDRSSTYILAKVDERGEYVAVLPKFEESGQFLAEIQMIGAGDQQIDSLSFNLDVAMDNRPVSVIGQLSSDIAESFLGQVVMAVLLLIILMVVEHRRHLSEI